jgi:ATP-binding cassette, subfamily B, bacterial PglK
MLKFWNNIDLKEKFNIIILFFSFFLIGFFDVLTISIIPIALTYVISPEVFLSFLSNDSLRNFFINRFESLPIDLKIFYSSIIIISAFILKNLIVYGIYFNESTYLKNLKLKLQYNVYTSYINKNYIDLFNFSQTEMLRDNELCNNTTSYLRSWLIAFKEIIIICGLYLAISINDKNIAYFIIIFFPFFIFIHFFLSARIRNWGNQITIYRKNTIDVIRETFDFFAEIKIFKKINIFSRRFLNETHNFEQRIYYQKLVTYFYKPFFEIVFIFFIFLIIFYFYKNQYTLNQIIPTISLIVFAFIRILPSISSLLVSINTIKFFEKSASLVLSKYKKLELKALNYKSKKQHVGFDQEISIQKLKFKYKGSKNYLLKDISFKINKNDKIAIIGKNGSGKTSLINIISGLLQFDSGNIVVDSKLKFTSKDNFLWKDSGYFKQNSPILQDSIKNNIILFDNGSFKKNKFNQIMKLIDYKNNFSKRILNEKFSYGGSKFSGGQRQIISLARTFYVNSELNFLDEPTNNLDENAKKRVIEFISKNKNTFVIITHDIEVLKKCNKILILENGRIKNFISTKKFLSNKKSLLSFLA